MEQYFAVLGSHELWNRRIRLSSNLFLQSHLRSKLEPHRELIRELRRKGRTYREVALLFHERLGLYVAPSTLHSFVKVRAKHRKQTQFELPPIEPGTRQGPEPGGIAALRAKSLVATRKPTRFVFRENEPLTLATGGEQ